jgi:hypothetical protein
MDYLQQKQRIPGFLVYMWSLKTLCSLKTGKQSIFHLWHKLGKGRRLDLISSSWSRLLSKGKMRNAKDPEGL